MTPPWRSSRKRKWRIVDDRPPQPPRRDGRIEAVARTPIMGFRDDVVVRVRRDDDGARIDVRSASRYGRHDFGTNAARIRSLLEDIDDRLTADSDEGRARGTAAVAAAAETEGVEEGREAAEAAHSRTALKPGDKRPGDRGRAVGRDRAARHQILQMRQHRHAGGLEQARIELE